MAEVAGGQYYSNSADAFVFVSVLVSVSVSAYDSSHSHLRSRSESELGGESRVSRKVCTMVSNWNLTRKRIEKRAG